MTTVRLHCVLKEVLSWKREKAEQACTLKLKFIKGQTAAGKDVYAMVTFPHVNPEVSDGDMYEVADLLGSLQARTVSGIVRVDSANLVALG